MASLFSRLLRRFGYFRVADYGLIVTESGKVIRISDGAVVNAAPGISPPQFRALTPPHGLPPTERAQAKPAPLFDRNSPAYISGYDPTVPSPAVEPSAEPAPSPTRSRALPPPIPVARRVPRLAPTQRTVIDRSEKATVVEPVKAAGSEPFYREDEKTLIDLRPNGAEAEDTTIAPKPADPLPRLSKRLADRKKAG